MTVASTVRASEIIRTCARAGQPARAAAFIASGDMPSKVDAILKREAAARLRGLGADAARASMKKQLTAQGMTPREDPGAGLSPGQASMAHVLAR